MNRVLEISVDQWNQRCPGSLQELALGGLEGGCVLYFPQLGFPLGRDENRLLSPTAGSKRKNISVDLRNGRLYGSTLHGEAAESLTTMMLRFAGCACTLISNLFPHFRLDTVLARTSYRPVEVAVRSISWRKDDTRLHVDSFPASPVGGNRILRVFSNINPEERYRTWRIGEPFDRVAERFLPALTMPVWGSGALLRCFRITRSRRSRYDHLMLQLHDSMKADMNYQSSANQILFDFPAGSTWIAFTDQVSHAAIAGQYLLEQTFYLPVACMAEPSKSPLRILEGLTGRKLV